ncbi:MAG: hypothetical protein AAFQ22_11340 [Pseudomonadota bacterium]
MIRNILAVAALSALGETAAAQGCLHQNTFACEDSAFGVPGMDNIYNDMMSGIASDFGLGWNSTFGAFQTPIPEVSECLLDCTVVGENLLATCEPFSQSELAGGLGVDDPNYGQTITNNPNFNQARHWVYLSCINLAERDTEQCVMRCTSPPIPPQ